MGRAPLVGCPAVCCHLVMEGERARAEGALGHPVSVVLDAADGLPLVAGSTIGRELATQ